MRLIDEGLDKLSPGELDQAKRDGMMAQNLLNEPYFRDKILLVIKDRAKAYQEAHDGADPRNYDNLDRYSYDKLYYDIYRRAYEEVIDIVMRPINRLQKIKDEYIRRNEDKGRRSA